MSPASTTWSLDHMFIASDEPGIASMLVNIGWSPAFTRRHTGQGTANQCFQFHNAYVELLFAVDSSELEHPNVVPLNLNERTAWPHTGACPFGLCLRAPLNGGSQLAGLSTWDYIPPGSPLSRRIQVLTPRGAKHEPLVFLADQAVAPARSVIASTPTSTQIIAEVKIHLPQHIDSMQWPWLAQCPFVTLLRGERYLLELVLRQVGDEGTQGNSSSANTQQVVTFPAALPLQIRW